MASCPDEPPMAMALIAAWCWTPFEKVADWRSASSSRPSPREGIELDPLRRLDRLGLRVRGRTAADGRRHRGRADPAQAPTPSAASRWRPNVSQASRVRRTTSPIISGCRCRTTGARRPSLPPRRAATSR